MAILLIIAPYGVFAFLMLVTPATVSLFAATAVCLAVIALDAMRGRSLKILGAGSAIVFAALGLYDFVVGKGQHIANYLPIILLVLHHQNTLAHAVTTC